jgi:hypothetical protein
MPRWPAKKPKTVIAEKNDGERKLKAQSTTKRNISKLFDDEAECSGDEESDEEQSEEEEEEDELNSDDESFINNEDTNIEPSKSKSSSNEQTKKRVRVNALSTCKKPGDITLPVNSFSLTISKIKDDVPFQLLQNLHDHFVLKYCLKGAIATETGVRIGNLHIQGILHLHCTVTGPTFKLMSKFDKLQLNFLILN